jgi:hypothetical protein
VASAPIQPPFQQLPTPAATSPAAAVSPTNATTSPAASAGGITVTAGSDTVPAVAAAVDDNGEGSTSNGLNVVAAPFVPPGLRPE